MRNRPLPRLASVLQFALLVACGTGPTNPGDPTPPPVASVRVSPDSASVVSGGTVQFAARVLDAAGAELTGRTVTWSSADGSVATIDSGTGVATGVAAGLTMVTATSEGRSDSAVLTVVAPGVVVGSVRVSPDSASVTPGATVQYTARAFDPAGNEIQGESAVWTVADPGVATIDATGTANGVAAGVTTVTATIKGQSDSAVLSVAAPTVSVDSVEVSPDSASIVTGATFRYSARVFDANGNELMGRAISWSLGNPALASISSDGTVTAGASAGTTSVTASSEGQTDSAILVVRTPPPPPPVGGALGCDVLTKGTIAQAAQVDEYTFDGSAGQVIALILARVSGFAGGVNYTVLAPSGTSLGVVSANNQRDFTLPATGTYTVQVKASNLTDSGVYHLNFECLSPIGSDAVGLAYGDLVTSSIDELVEADIYAFSGTSGEVASVTLAETSGFANAAVAFVYDPAGTHVLTITANDQKNLALSSSGTYVIEIVGWGYTDTGSYALGLESVKPASSDHVAISYGDLVSGSLDAFAETDLFTFSGTSGEVASMTLAETSGFANAAVAFVYDPAGTHVLTITANDQKNLALSSSGTYVIAIVGWGYTDTGSYALGLESVKPASSDHVAISYGDLVSGSLDAFAETDLITFSGSSGEVASMTLAETSGFPNAAVAFVYDPAGTHVLTITANDQKNLALSSSGTYVIAIVGWGYTDTGSYALGLESVKPASSDHIAISYGDLVSGSIDAFAETDLFTFNGTSGEVASITLTETSGFANAAVAFVYDPAGVHVLTITANDQKNLTLTSSGTYVIAIVGWGYTDTGSYSLGLN